MNKVKIINQIHIFISIDNKYKNLNIKYKNHKDNRARNKQWGASYKANEKYLIYFGNLIDIFINISKYK
jgi:hypothetical protein